MIRDKRVSSASLVSAFNLLGPPAAGLAVLACLFLVLDTPPNVALAALWDGAFGNYESLANTLVKSCPLILSGCGLALAFKAGFWNIGGEGQILMGALAAAAWVSATGGVSVWMILTLGILGGSLWAGLAGLLRHLRGIQEVISTLMLNFVALYLVSFAIHGPLQERAGSYPQTDLLPAGLRMVRTWPGFSLPIFPSPSGRVHLGVVLALILAVFCWFLLARTVPGFFVRAAGKGARALQFSGVSSAKVVLWTAVLSGGFCGLAGAMEYSSVTFRLYENFSGGYGFTAIAVALLARLNPLGVIPSGIFFAALATGAAAMQRSLGIPAVSIYVVQAVVIASFALSVKSND